MAALEEAAGDTSEIGDANYKVVATALGTLCNRIFGSGSTTPDFSRLSSSGASSGPAPLPTGFVVPTDGPSS